MNQEKQVPSDVLMDSVVSKVQKQEQRIQAQDEKLTRMEENIKAIPDHSKDWEEAKATILELVAVSKGQKTLMEKLQDFFRSLDIAVNLLRHPVESKVQHQHHFSKIAWITAGLFLTLCLVCSGWYMTAQTISQHKAGDIKYRQLKLTSDSASLRFLWRLDSLYMADPDKMEKVVTEQEQLKQKRLELIDQLQAVNSKIGQDKKTGQTPQKGK